MSSIMVKEVVKYNGHSLSANGSVNLSLKADYSELTNSIKVLQLLNYDVLIKAKVNSKTINLGTFRVKQVVMDGDGESILKFNGLADYVELDNLNILPLKGEDETDMFQILMKAEFEKESEEEEEN